MQDPVTVGMFLEKPIVLSRGGELVYHLDDQPVRVVLDLSGEISFSTFCASGLKIALVVDSTLFRYELSSGEMKKLYECTEEIGGVSINNEGDVVCWAGWRGSFCIYEVITLRRQSNRRNQLAVLVKLAR